MEFDIKQLLYLLWQKIYWIITCAVIGGAIAFLISYFMITPIYTASASLYVYNNDGSRNTNTISQSDLVASQKLVDTYIVIIKSDTVLEKVARASGYNYSANRIRSMLSASSINGTEAFTIKISNENPVVAKDIANTITDVVPDEIRRIVKSSEVVTIDRAKVPSEPSSPNIPFNTVLGILIGFALCVAIVVVRSLFDTTIHSEEDLNDFNIPVLGVIPALDIDLVTD